MAKSWFFFIVANFFIIIARFLLIYKDKFLRLKIRIRIIEKPTLHRCDGTLLLANIVDKRTAFSFTQCIESSYMPMTRRSNSSIYRSRSSHCAWKFQVQRSTNQKVWHKRVASGKIYVRVASYNRKGDDHVRRNIMHIRIQ